jgi:nucleoside-triphosphatase
MNNILITGIPGVGKTTFIIHLSKALGELRPAGFITREIRDAGTRVGFEIVGFDGSHRLLSHIDIMSRYRVGKYGVDIDGFEEHLAMLDLEGTGNNPVIIDEIGKMECHSALFREMIVRLLDSDRLFIATIARRGTPFIESVKGRDGVLLFEVTRENRDNLAINLMKEVRRIREQVE